MRVVLILGLMLAASVAQAQSGTIPVQGVLEDQAGAAVNGNLMVRFTIYQDPAGTVSLWSEEQGVGFTEGQFTAYLGEVETLDLQLFQENPQTYLGIAFDGDVEMPLIELGNVPYAAYAAFSGDAASVGGIAPADLNPLGGLSCMEGQVAAWDGTGWTCGAGSPLGGLSCNMGQVAQWSGTGWTCADLATSFTALSDVPPGLSALGGLSCANGQTAEWQGGTWTCGTGASYSGNAPISVVGNTISLTPIDDSDISGGAGINPLKILGTAATLTGDQSFDTGTLYIDAAANEVGIGTTAPQARLDVRGGIQTDGPIQYRTPQARTLNLASPVFVTNSDSDDDFLTRASSGYMYMGGGVTPYGAQASAPVHLPAGATLNSMTCYVYDSNTSENLSGTAILYSRAPTTTFASSKLSTSLATSGNSSSVTSVSDTTVSGSATVNATDTLHLYVSLSTSVTGTSLRFYGCSIDYRVNGL
ncbi:MAG: hypothetical protein AAGF12_13725 [Myxococcota bacterium]